MLTIRMLQSINISNIFVLDQDEALDFYVGTLGLEVGAGQVRDLVTKGATGFAVGFTTDDWRKTYEALVARGVEITQESTEQIYGIDMGIRDPFGNHIRIVQLGPVPQQDSATVAPV